VILIDAIGRTTLQTFRVCRQRRAGYDLVAGWRIERHDPGCAGAAAPSPTG
jgi:hypothetical protein